MPAASTTAISYEDLVVVCPCCPATCVQINNADFLGMVGGNCVLYGFGIDGSFDTIYGYYDPFRDIRAAMNVSALGGTNYETAYSSTSGAITGSLYATEADAISETSPTGTLSLSFTFDCADDSIVFDASLIDINAVEPDIVFPTRTADARILPGIFTLADTTAACPSFTIELGNQIPPP